MLSSMLKLVPYKPMLPLPWTFQGIMKIKIYFTMQCMSTIAEPNQEKPIFYLFAILRLQWKKSIYCGNQQEKKNPAARERSKEAGRGSDRS